jgi:integrase
MCRILADILCKRGQPFIPAKWLHFKPVMTGKETDTLPLNRILVEALTKPKATAKSEWVFVNKQGKPFKSIRTAFATACRRVNLSDVTPR